MRSYALGFFLIIFLSKINGSHQICDESEFVCNNGFCVDNFLVCDGVKHCKDGSDETRRVCSASVCPSFAFRCSYGACIDQKHKCDGNPDCADGSDESALECGEDGLDLGTTNSPGIGTNSQRTCPSGKFACDSDQCISDFLICDGEVNCRDGSDESLEMCNDFPCPPTVGFQCAYGACIDQDKKCDNQKDCADGSDEDPKVCGTQTTPQPFPQTYKPIIATIPDKLLPTVLPITDNDAEGCILPEQQIGGFYNVKDCDGPNSKTSICRAQPGTRVAKYSLMTLECYNGYRLETNISKVVCIDSEWSPPIPKCLRLCPPLKSNSLIISCNYKGTPVECGEAMLPGTRVNMKCKPFFKYQGSDYITGISLCNNDGVWTENLFQCKPECGQRTSNRVTPLISKGTSTSAVEYPWHTALYKFDPKDNDYELFCGGSIITPYMILSAAHCFEPMSDPSKLIVIVGKTNRAFQIHDPDEQRIHISNIYIHPDYTGSRNWYSFDLAILELTNNIEIGTTAMPVCLETVPPWTVLENGTPGTAVGFGKNERGDLSDHLMVTQMPFTDQQTCWKGENELYRSFITHDKFCALYTNGAGVQQGDSGGGLVFQKKETNLYFIRGIVSIKNANSNKYVIFTNVSEKTHNSFITETQLKLSLKHS